MSDLRTIVVADHHKSVSVCQVLDSGREHVPSKSVSGVPQPCGALTF